MKGTSTWSSSPIPQFGKEEQVLFVGGSGKIKSCFRQSGMWLYLVEMELGPEPEMGRIGPETTIVLHQTELQPIPA